jgi:hypothetical protein
VGNSGVRAADCSNFFEDSVFMESGHGDEANASKGDALAFVDFLFDFFFAKGIPRTRKRAARALFQQFSLNPSSASPFTCRHYSRIETALGLSHIAICTYMHACMHKSQKCVCVSVFLRFRFFCMCVRTYVRAHAHVHTNI